ncbi:MAG: hypothetical protein WC209_13840 [Ignavibacteriaceae bacterium]|jgi:hypothetical protein
MLLQAQVNPVPDLTFIVLAVMIISVLIMLLFYFIIRDRKRRDEIHDLKNQLNTLLLQRELEDEEKNSHS